MLKNLSKYYQLFTRISLFVIYFWFGILKLFDVSPAGPLVEELLAKTLSFIDPSLFMILFGLFEMGIGLLFLFPKINKITIGIALLHLFTTTMPLILLPNITWQKFLVPTLEGQYIIKNLLVVSALIGLETVQSDKENK